MTSYGDSFSGYFGSHGVRSDVVCDWFGLPVVSVELSDEFFVFYSVIGGYVVFIPVRYGVAAVLSNDWSDGFIGYCVTDVVVFVLFGIGFDGYEIEHVGDDEEPVPNVGFFVVGHEDAVQYCGGTVEFARFVGLFEHYDVPDDCFGALENRCVCGGGQNGRGGRRGVGRDVCYDYAVVGDVGFVVGGVLGHWFGDVFVLVHGVLVRVVGELVLVGDCFSCLSSWSSGLIMFFGHVVELFGGWCVYFRGFGVFCAVLFGRYGDGGVFLGHPNWR